MKIGSHDVEIKNRDKVFFPEEKITKGNLIDYYEKIADSFIPFLKDRPLSLNRFPDGITEEGFYQKQVSDYFPDWIDTVEIEKKEGGTNSQVVCNSKATLIYLVNQGTVSFHPWLCKTDNLHKPDKLVFDLDPPQGNFEIVVKGAKALRSLLEKELGLNAFLMTTGSKGLHVVCPIKPEKDFEDVRSFAKDVADYLADNNPDTFTTKTRKDQRKGRLFIDYLRNAYAQTSIPPYSVRAREGAPVATPLGWNELNKEGLHSQSYTIKNIFKRLSQKDEPWSQFNNKATKLKKSTEKLNGLTTE
ncbi:MAG: non-homologous end-joining DNA ligase [Balneolaceae bacterium]|nr:non-homologous end-joining DNA ligase [Balneolaceae bacterium]